MAVGTARCAVPVAERSVRRRNQQVRIKSLFRPSLAGGDGAAPSLPGFVKGKPHERSPVRRDHQPGFEK